MFQHDWLNEGADPDEESYCFYCGHDWQDHKTVEIAEGEYRTECPVDIEHDDDEDEE